MEHVSLLAAMITYLDFLIYPMNYTLKVSLVNLFLKWYGNCFLFQMNVFNFCHFSYTYCLTCSMPFNIYYNHILLCIFILESSSSYEWRRNDLWLLLVPPNVFFWSRYLLVSAKTFSHTIYIQHETMQLV